MFYQLFWWYFAKVLSLRRCFRAGSLAGEDRRTKGFHFPWTDASSVCPPLPQSTEGWLEGSIPSPLKYLGWIQAEQHLDNTVRKKIWEGFKSSGCTVFQCSFRQHNSVMSFTYAGGQSPAYSLMNNFFFLMIIQSRCISVVYFYSQYRDKPPDRAINEE